MPGPHSIRRILVADDEDRVCRFIRDGLGSCGFDVELSPDGRELLNRYRPGGHDLLILDRRMGGRSGMEVVTRLRDNGDDVPIILMADSARPGGRIEPFAFTYRIELLRKPFGLADLRGAVGRAASGGFSG
jgi:CheY-like chemotaxis protein